MAYGNLTDYEAGPSGNSLYVTDKSGRKTLVIGDTALDLKKKLDASKNVQPMLAGTNPYGTNPANQPKVGGMPANQLKFGGMPPELPQSKLDARSAMAELEGEYNPSNAETFRDIVNPPEPAKAATSTVAPKWRQQSINKDGSINEVSDSGEIRVRHPARAGSKGGPVERGRTEAGGFEQDPDYVKGMADLDKEALANIEEQKKLGQEEAAREAGFLEEQKKQQKVAFDEEVGRQQQAMKRVAEMEAKRDAAVEAFKSSKIDPNRTFASTGSSIANGLLAIAGAIGAGMSKGPNYVAAYIDKRVNDDIHAQEADIQVRGQAADNALADLNRELGNMDLAKSTLRSIQREQTATGLELMAAKSKDKKISAQATAEALRLRKASLQDKEEYRQKSLAHVTKSIVNAPAVAPTRERLSLPTADQLEYQTNLAAKGKDNKSTQEGGADVKRRLADIESNEAALNKLELSSGKAGHVVATGALGSSESQEFGSDVASIAPGLARAIEGDAATQDTMDQVKSELQSLSPEKRAIAIAAYRARLTEKKRAILAGQK